MFRDALDCLQVNDLLNEHRVALHLLDLNVDTSNAMGKAFLTIAAAFAELELNRGKERTRDALAALKRRGVSLGAVPFGEQVDNSQDARTFSEELSEGKVIELMARLRTQGLTYQQIADALNQSGVPTKLGKNGWMRGTVHRILKRFEEISCGKPSAEEDVLRPDPAPDLPVLPSHAKDTRVGSAVPTVRLLHEGEEPSS
jgi:DNA invertase Pin-like site-specific DNA recombinase